MKEIIPVFADYYVPDTVHAHPLTEAQYQEKAQRIKQLLREKNAVIIAHYYTDANIQRLAEETGGLVSDSFAMAQFGRDHTADTLVVCGVKFMGETAKILSPQKRVLMPTIEATCSLSLSCPAEPFSQFCDEHPDRAVVVYVNSSAEVKARADWVVTSRIAVDVIDHLAAEGHKILWAPDYNLGHYISEQTDADMLLWRGGCVVHQEFQAKLLADLKKQYPDAAVLVHPESPEAVIKLGDVVGSTYALLKASQTLPNKIFIVATDEGIIYQMQKASPDKQFIKAPTAGHGATCKSCGHCPWMAMNTLDLLESSLREGLNEIKVPQNIIERAVLPLTRMVEFTV